MNDQIKTASEQGWLGCILGVVPGTDSVSAIRRTYTRVLGLLPRDEPAWNGYDDAIVTAIEECVLVVAIADIERAYKKGDMHEAMVLLAGLTKAVDNFARELPIACCEDLWTRRNRLAIVRMVAEVMGRFCDWRLIHSGEC